MLYIKKIKTKKGKEVLLRPIKPEDEPMEAEMFTHFSDQTQRFRFFGKIKDITHEMLIKYTQIDYDREMAIIAESDSKMLGVVRLISNPYDESAEFAIVVADPYQNQGLGEKMTDYMIEIAKQRGIRKIFAYFLSDNEVMEHIFEKRGFKIIREQKSCRAEKEL
jgi:acetyltransferase